MSKEEFKVGVKTRKHVIQQLSKIEKTKKVYDPMLWGMMLLYIVVGTGWPLLDAGMYIIILFEVIIFLFITMFVYVKVDKMRQAATSGKLYADIRNNIGDDEIMEQATIKEITTLVVPADPYPWAEVMIDFGDVEPLFKSLGAKVKIKTTTEIQAEMSQYIKDQAKILSKEAKEEEKKDKKIQKMYSEEEKRIIRDAIRNDTTPVQKSRRQLLIEKLSTNYGKWQEEKVKEEEAKIEVPLTESVTPLIKIDGVSEKTAVKLEKLGITSIEQLANSNPEMVGKIKFMGTIRAAKIIETAKMWHEKYGEEKGGAE